MKKSEVFALLTGLIGLAADLITICLFISQKASGGPAPSLASNIIIAGSMIYGWFIISWVLVRRAWVRYSAKKPKWTLSYFRQDALYKRATYTVAATGFLLLPLQWLFLSIVLPFNDTIFHDGPQKTNKLQWFSFICFISIISLAVIGASILAAMGLLMPVIYEDMEDLNDMDDAA